MISFCRALAVGAALMLAAGGIAFAAESSAGHPVGHMQPMAVRAAGPTQPGAVVPTMPGQDAFGAIQEIVHILEADPNTDWSKVNLEALRQHLIDMNEVTLHAAADQKPIAGGITVAVTGTGRTIPAIKRMVADQAAMIEAAHPNGWSASAEPLPNGVNFVVTAKDPKQIAIIRGLGFIGVMASGNYHQMHHLAMAKGEFMHMH